MDLASSRPPRVSVPSRAKKGCTTVWYHKRASLWREQQAMWLKQQVNHVH